MCTVTYIPLKNGFVLTSSRDEKVYRPTLKPKVYAHSNGLLVYPKDEIGNGTWIATSNKSKIACLLNGGFQNHKKKENYTISRGKILIQCFDYNSFDEAIENLDLCNVEPFTLLLIDFEAGLKFNQLVWDGEQKHFKIINPDVPLIWSSSTLYSDQDRELRKCWFENWININKQIKDCNILNFHSVRHGKVDSKDILMKRESGLQTVSISQIKIGKTERTFSYCELNDLNTTTINLNKLECTQV